jgi:hypothetical protein
MGAGPKCICPVALIVSESPERRTMPVAVQYRFGRNDTLVTVADAAGDAARTAVVINANAMPTAAAHLPGTRLEEAITSYIGT